MHVPGIYPRLTPDNKLWYLNSSVLKYHWARLSHTSLWKKHFHLKYVMLMWCVQWNKIPLYVSNDLNCINRKILLNYMQIKISLSKHQFPILNSKKSPSVTSALDLWYFPTKYAWLSYINQFLICKILNRDIFTCFSKQIVKKTACFSSFLSLTLHFSHNH